MPKLFCVVVGDEGSPFSVNIAADETVDDLKKKIKVEKPQSITCDADRLQLYLAKNGLSRDEAKAVTLDEDGIVPGCIKMDELLRIQNDYHFGMTFQPEEGKIYVLVVVPEGAVPSICPKISVTNLLRQNSLPDMEFMEAMKQPVGFKIPVSMFKYVSMWPDTFTQGDAEYETTVDTILRHRIASGSEMAVVSIDSLWFTLFLDLCECTIFQDETHESSSAKGKRPDGVIVKGNVLVGKCEAKASQKDMATATKELTEKMADAAFCTFPRGLTSIPAWTTCATRIQLHQLSYLPATKTYETRVLESYDATDANHRQRFVVDLFKIMKWVLPIQEPNTLMHLVPQVRTVTTNGHYVTWLKTGLFKQFREDAEINMEIIRKVYNAPLQHVERGICNHVSVTITSIGQTLQNALVDFQGNRDLIIEQVKSALVELHSIGVAHCDVRAANVFVLLENKRVILGDLEYCRDIYAPPPNVKRFPKNKLSCKTALQLDNYQFGVFVDELAQM